MALGMEMEKVPLVQTEQAVAPAAAVYPEGQSVYPPAALLDATPLFIVEVAKLPPGAVIHGVIPIEYFPEEQIVQADALAP